MRWALIQGGAVANVVEQDDQPTIPGQWVACGNAGPGWTYDGEDFEPPASAMPGPPQSVSMAQARIAMSRAGITEAQVTAVIEAMPNGQAKTETRIWWERSNAVERAHPAVAALAPALGLSEAQIDDLFTVAASI